MQIYPVIHYLSNTVAQEQVKGANSMAEAASKPALKRVNLPGYPDMPLSLWGKATLLLDLLYQTGRLPEYHVYGDAAGDGYSINGIPVGRTEEQVTTCIWLMAESYAAEGHIDFQNNPSVAEAALEA